jgi:protein O-GlcNAc transferase
LDEAIAFYCAAVAVRPEMAHALAHALEDQGNRDESIAHYRELFRRRPDNFRHYYCLGRALKEQEKLNEALIAYDQALALRDDQAQIHFSRGVVLKAMGDLSGAVAAYERAIGRVRLGAPLWPVVARGDDAAEVKEEARAY